MTIAAEVIAHSASALDGKEICTLRLRYPRFIHAEFMTHRMFSRNASSSRAIPVERLIQDVLDDTAMPIHWGKNQPGMQAREEHDDWVMLGLYENVPYDPSKAWRLARNNAIGVARAFAKAGYHKQIVNRLLEPFAHINVLVTATEWDNFFELRDHEDAQPEIRALAQAMKAAMAASTPRILGRDGWHLPFVTEDERQRLPIYVARKLSAARCARVSYLTHDGENPNVTSDIRLYDRLVGSSPLHASPLEHQATPMTPEKDAQPFHSNLKRWVQFRKLVEESQQ